MAIKELAGTFGGLKELVERINDIDGFEVKAGWFPGQVHPVYGEARADGSREIDGYIPMAQIAVINEWGEGRIPPRPFLRPTLSNNRGLWREQIKKGALGIIRGVYSGEQVMEGIGLSVSGHIREQIASIHTPPLAPFTIQQRLSFMANQSLIGKLDKPLIFTGIFYGGVSYQVQDKPVVSPWKKGGET